MKVSDKVERNGEAGTVMNIIDNIIPKFKSPMI